MSFMSCNLFYIKYFLLSEAFLVELSELFSCTINMEMVCSPKL
jgi:hypothetical protein